MYILLKTTLAYQIANKFPNSEQLAVLLHIVTVLLHIVVLESKVYGNGIIRIISIGDVFVGLLPCVK